MAEERKLDATFFAFRKRDRRGVLTRAAGAYLGVYLLVCAAYAVLAWTSFAPVYGWYMNAIVVTMEGGEPPAAPAELASLIPIGVVMALAFWVLFAALEAACLRWLVRSESGGGLLGLKLGADTWRVFAIYWLWLLITLAVFVVVAVIYVMLQAIGSIGGGLQLAAIIAGGLAPLGLLALWIWVAVRLAPAAATSIAEQRFVFFGAWRVTRGYFWQLLGSFVIIIAGYCVVALLAGQVLQMPVNAVMTPIMQEILAGGDSGQAVRRLSEAMQTPTVLIFGSLYVIASAVIAAVYYVASFGVNACVVLASRESA